MRRTDLETSRAAAAEHLPSPEGGAGASRFGAKAGRPFGPSRECAPTPKRTLLQSRDDAEAGRAKDLPSFGRGNGDRPNGRPELRGKRYAAGGLTSAPSRLSGSADLVLETRRLQGADRTGWNAPSAYAELARQRGAGTWTRYWLLRLGWTSVWIGRVAKLAPVRPGRHSWIGVGALFAWRTTEGYSHCGSRPVGRPGASVRCATRGLCLTVGCLGLRASVPEKGVAEVWVRGGSALVGG